jgi:tripartite-type tricarboxylate transporter receptor subunit TctC
VMLPVIAALVVVTAHADDTYPDRTVTIVVPFAPGASTDVLGRIAASALNSALKEPFIVDNRPGAAGVTAAAHVARSAPDGFTLLHTATNFAITAHLYEHIPYDPIADFQPVSLVGTTNFIAVANPSLNVHSIADLIALAKSESGKLSYGSAGVGSTYHLFAELFQNMAGVKLQHVPYRGGGPALLDVVAGQVALMFCDLAPAMPLIRDGKLIALGVTAPTTLRGTSRRAVDWRNATRLRWHRLAGPAGSARHQSRHRWEAQRGAAHLSWRSGDRRTLRTAWCRS